VSIAGTVMLVLTFILPVLNASAIGITVTWSIFDLLSPLGLVIYLISLIIGGVVSKYSYDQKSGFGISIISFILGGFVVLVFGMAKDDLNYEAQQILSTEIVSYDLGYYTALIGIFLVLGGGVLSRTFKQQQMGYQSYGQSAWGQPQQYYQSAQPQNVGYQPQPPQYMGEDRRSTPVQATSQAPEAPDIYCPECGTQRNGNFCVSCGYKF
jgi:hypothetical protein